MAKLTDRQRKRIVADYIECENYSAVARKHKVSATTVKNLVRADPQSAKKFDQKKEQNTADMLTYMESRKGTAQKLVDLYLKALQDPAKIKDAPLNQIATSLGIVIDKFTKTTSAGNSDSTALENMINLIDLIRNPTPNREIPDDE